MFKKPQVDLAKVDITSVLDVVSAVQLALVRSGKSQHATMFLQQALMSSNGSEIMQIAKRYVEFAYPSFNFTQTNNMFDGLTDDDDDDDDDFSGDDDDDTRFV